ncbi:MAG: pseudouridine synthase [Bdellovibrionales bacterium]
MGTPIKTLTRLNKFLADSGITSRRKADTLIEEGAVQVNGKTVYELGVKVTPGVDRVTVNGKPIKVVEQRIYLAFYKPENVLTSMSDPEGRMTVADFVQKLPMRVFPVGRLDWDTEGLLLLTNDGDFAQQISHPKAAIPKTYYAKLNAEPTQEKLSKLLRGVTIPGGKASALHVEKIKLGTSEKYAWVKIVITEGRNRQVRKMFEKIGFDVKKLKRVAIGRLELGPLTKGQFVFLGPKGVKEALSPTWPQKRSEREARRAANDQAAAPGTPAPRTRRPFDRENTGGKRGPRPPSRPAKHIGKRQYSR